jgi:hypothetical protein
MNHPSAMPLSAPSLAATTGGTRRKISIGGLSINGLLLFVASLLVVASGFTGLRPNVFGLSLHPFLVPVALAFPFVMMSRIGEFPPRIAAALLVFAAIYIFSIFSGGGLALGEAVKIGTSLVTIVTCSLLVRKRGDFVAGVLGLSLAIAILAVNGLQDDTGSGFEGMEGANKNSYSLFALPAILMAGYIGTRMPTVPTAVKAMLIACVLPALAAIFMSGNRSGYLGSALIALMLFWDRKGKGLLLVAMVAGALIFWLTQFGTTAIFDQRMQQTMSGLESDRLRQEVVLTCFQIGLENPLIGVSPQMVPIELGRRLSVLYRVNYLDSHNVFAHVIAASGVFCLLALVVVGWTMWAWKPRNGVKIWGKGDPLRDARQLLRMMLVLWVMRGMFTREILYNPSFCIGLGLCIGLCLLAEVARGESGPQRARPRGVAPWPAGPLPVPGR